MPANSSQFEIIHSAQVGGPTGMKEVVEYFKKLNGAKGWGEWEVDQVLFVSFFCLFVLFNFLFFFAKCIKSHPLCQNSKVAVSLTHCHFRIQPPEGQDRTG